MLGKIFGVLFCGIFAAVGVGMFAFKTLPTIKQWMDAKSWYSVPAELESYDLDVGRSDDSTTYEAIARYRYEVDGRSYVSHQVNLHSGSDNIGSYQQDMNHRLSRITPNGEPLLVWVNPVNPNEAVIDRDMRWGMLMFESVFVFIFGGFGLGGLLMMYRYRNLGKPLASTDNAKPWLQYQPWNSATLLSNAKTGNRVMLGFAIFWNAISIPASIAIIEPLRNGDYKVAFVLLFPMVGIFLFWMWYKMHRSYQRTGPMPLTLDPYPGSIGGQVGGTIELSKRHVQLKNAQVTVQCIHTYTSGSGDNRKTRERVIWENSMVPAQEMGFKGPSFSFCFDVEPGLPISEPPLDMPRNTWRVSFAAQTNDGIEVERDYDDLPVFETAQQSSLRDKDAYSATSFATLEANEKLVESILDIKSDVRGHRLDYPPYRNKGVVFLIPFGLVFLVAGILIPQMIFNIVFPLLGGITMLIGIYSFFNSLEVRLGAEGITSQRSLLGYKFKPKFVASYSFKELKPKMSSSSSSGKKTTQYFKIIAHGNDGEEAVVAEGLKGLNEAQLAIEKLESVLNYQR